MPPLPASYTMHLNAVVDVPRPRSAGGGGRPRRPAHRAHPARHRDAPYATGVPTSFSSATNGQQPGRPRRSDNDGGIPLEVPQEAVGDERGGLSRAASSSWREPRSPTTPRVEGSGRPVLACPTPAASTPPTNSAPEPATAGGLDPWPTSLARSLAPGGLAACHGVHRPRFQGQGRPPGQAFKRDAP
jgi:hypothetical protein